MAAVLLGAQRRETGESWAVGGMNERKRHYQTNKERNLLSVIVKRITSVVE